MQRNTVQGPEFLKMHIQKQDIIKVLNDVSVEGDVLRKIEKMVLNALQHGYLNVKVRPRNSQSATGINSPRTRVGKLARLSNSADGFFNSAQRVKRRGSIEDRLDILKSEIERSGNDQLVDQIHSYLVSTKLASRLTGNYSPIKP
jgi:hypothetical protein